MALVILALDALDHEHVETYDCDTLQLNNTAPLETFSYGLDHPYTLEVWPSVATGLHPRDHGISKAGASDWDNPFVAVVSKLLNPLPKDVRWRLGDYAETVFGATWDINETDAPTFFDGDTRVVHNWPGVINSHVLRQRWASLETAATAVDRPRAAFDRDVLAGGAEKFGWVREMLNHDVELIAAHIHTIDLAGHAYGDHPDHYAMFYEWMDAQVASLLEELGADDELVILSDHGMGLSSVEDDVPGRHTFRAMVSTTLDDDLPATVFDVKEWVEEHIVPVEVANRGEMDIDTEHLKDLGYM